MPGENALAYYDISELMTVKSFITLAPAIIKSTLIFVFILAHNWAKVRGDLQYLNTENEK